MKRCVAMATALLVALTAWLAGHYQAMQTQQLKPWDQQVYLWQRVWTPEHATALAASHDLFSTLRVLGLQVHPHDGFRVIPVNRGLLQQDSRPLWLVVRLDGQLQHLNASVIHQQLMRLLLRWQTAGLTVIGIEIDHDAATAQLPEYQQFLRQLRQQLPASLQLGITVLPTWLTSPVLPRVLQQVDSSVLQVHAVLSPKQGLFDGPLALRWISQFARISPHPFRVALPAYGMGLVGFDTQGALVESETPLRVAGYAQELTVAPQQIASFLQQLALLNPRHFRGIVWFRLPLDSDRRAWSIATLRAVINRQPLATQWQVEFLPQQNGLYDLNIQNSGPIDAPLPKEIRIKANGCLAADAVGNYQLATTSEQPRFIRIRSDQLRSGQSRPLGWLHCQEITPGDTDVIP
ncbi:DUF3142 domain-containing protein [Serratia sp. UGAL515B_01]|uniref:DUF3142 domain-containing protein n=1 Tax=Serratia sp. UGAL515B_01 TaxID=2986763 RepID=UPI0029548D2F|nr:DUF3142 domain-containing protein [Serratia sp. UGAL515B_01]WON79028.1 DUF3142 domain-containing protein [Serratia sp. UGAL515B_01]